MIAYRDTIKGSRAFQQFARDCRVDKLSQSYMIVAPDRETLQSMLMMMSEAIYCDNGNACGECLACRRIENRNNSNISILDKEDSIKVEDIIDFIRDVGIAASEDGQRLYIITHGDKMNEIAQNKLLKTLEDPVNNTTIIIGVVNENAILQTIRSRCNIIYATVWNDITIYNELKQTDADTDTINLASQLARGSIESAKKIIADSSYRDKYKAVINVLENFNNSTQLPEYLSCFGSEREEMLAYLGILEQVISSLITNRNEEANPTLIKKFNIRTLSNIYDIVIDSYRRINSNCNITSTTSNLLLGILEMTMKLS